MDLPDGFVQEVLDDLSKLSGLVLFRVTCEWANKGREGKTNNIIIAKDAIEAVIKAWEVENDKDLRKVCIEWLCPVESIVSRCTWKISSDK